MWYALENTIWQNLMPTKIYMYLVKKNFLDPTKVCASTVFLNINCKISFELIDYIDIKKDLKWFPKRGDI